MKIQSIIVLFLVFLATAFVFPHNAEGQYFVPDSPSDSASNSCHEPLTWRIGKIDSRFGIDAGELMQIVEQAGVLWSEAAGRELIRYSADGEITINLFYSDQQRFISNKQALSDEIKSLRQKFYAMQLQFQAESADYQKLIRDFNKLQQEYNESVEEHNNIMMRVNGNGFMSSSDDQKIKYIKRRVHHIDQELSPLAREIQSTEQNLTERSNELNAIADQFNELLFRYRDRYDTWKTFHQGVYFKAGNQKKINIYTFQHLTELKVVLAHELGHALGIEHVSSPGSLMHYMADVAENESIQLSPDDINALMNLCDSLQLSSADLQQ